MKVHTFFLSGKALAIIGGSLVLSGGLVFATGLFAGLGIENALAAHNPMGGLHTAAAPAESTVVATASPTATDPGSWPFGGVDPAEVAPAPDSLPAAKPADPTKAKPAVPTKTKAAGQPATFGLVVYHEPAPAEQDAAPAADTATYVIQVGSFRVERNALALAARLQASGYRPTVTTKEDGNRPLHVVRVGRFKGLAAAAHSAERIGDSERLMASIVLADAHQ